MSLFASGVIILYVVTDEIITTFFAKRLFDISGKIKWGAATPFFDQAVQLGNFSLPLRGFRECLQWFTSAMDLFPLTIYYMYLYQIYYTFSAIWRKFFPRQISNVCLICVILHNPQRKLLFPDNCPPTDISSGTCVFFNK